MAILLAVREIVFLQAEAVRESDNQVYAHINAGDYTGCAQRLS
jgi:hypothetical protein